MSVGSINAKPATMELPDGTTATSAVLGAVKMRTVECADGGNTILVEAGDAAGAASHVKVTVNGIDLKESRFNSDVGLYQDHKIKMTQQKKADISMLSVEMDGQTYDLLTTDGKLQFLFAKSAGGVPFAGAKALMSLRYKSPLGGQWYVDKQPVNLELGETGGTNACCVLM